MIQVFKNPESLVALQADWDRLADMAGSPLLSYAWFYAAVITLHKDDELRVFVLKEGERICAIAPLYICKNGSSESLALLGASILYEPANLLYETHDNLIDLLKSVLTFGLPLTLLRMPQDSLMIQVMRELRWTQGLSIARDSAPSNYIDFKSFYEELDDAEKQRDFMGSISSSRKSELRRKRKCLEKLGKVRIEWLQPSLNTFEVVFNEALRIEDASWKGNEDSSLLKNKPLKDFFYQYVKFASEQGILRVCLVYVGGVAISMHLGIQSHKAFWVLKLGHDEQYNKCSPGIQTAMETILYSIGENLNCYEFLGSEEKWQEIWPVQQHKLSTYLFFPYSVKSLKAILSLILQQIKKRIFR